MNTMNTFIILNEIKSKKLAFWSKTQIEMVCINISQIESLSNDDKVGVIIETTSRYYHVREDIVTVADLINEAYMSGKLIRLKSNEDYKCSDCGEEIHHDEWANNDGFCYDCR